MEQVPQNLWQRLSEERSRERAQLKDQGLKDPQIDQLFWDRARNGGNLALGEAALHGDVPDNPHWPDTPDVLSEKED